MNLRTIFFAFMCLTVAGCEKESAAKIPIKVEVPQTPIAPQVTSEDWKKAVEATHEKLRVRDEGGGVEEFFACFEPTPEKKKKCTYHAFGKRDTFRKIRFYTSGIPIMIGSKISAYVSLPDNGEPSVFLAPYIFSRGSWIFMKKLAIMVDGEVILEKDLNKLEADREVFGGGVQERVDFIATPAQIEALRKIKPEGKFLVRITGEKGYITLDKEESSETKELLINVIRVYDSLNNAVKDKIPAAQQEAKS